jgi:DNA-binding transcriptional ArsR family regulator
MVAAATPTAGSMTLLDAPATVRLALSPIRQQLLARLSEPASATTLASELTMGRQRINYHLRALEAAGLVALVEERQKRGCVERVLVARARAFVVDPGVVTGHEPKDAAGRRARDSDSAVSLPAPVTSAEGAVTRGTSDRQDSFAASHLIATASGIVCDVTRMQGRAAERGERLLTFTFETDVAFATPADFEQFTSILAERVARTAAQFHQPAGGRRYRIVVGGHPSPSAPALSRRRAAP